MHPEVLEGPSKDWKVGHSSASSDCDYSKRGAVVRMGDLFFPVLKRQKQAFGNYLSRGSLGGFKASRMKHLIVTKHGANEGMRAELGCFM